MVYLPLENGRLGLSSLALLPACLNVATLGLAAARRGRRGERIVSVRDGGRFQVAAPSLGGTILSGSLKGSNLDTD